MRLQLAIADDVRIEDAVMAEALLRTAQEALTNAARHGSADTLHVQLRHEAGALLLAIHDDARAARNSAPLHEGHGLTGMRERIAAYGGSLRAGPRAEGGFELVAVLPTAATS